jgi:membrane peptidoglycan carboxypeptidase
MGGNSGRQRGGGTGSGQRLPLSTLFRDDAERELEHPLGMSIAAIFVVGALVGLAIVGATGARIGVKVWESMPVQIPDITGIPGRTQLVDRNGDKFAEFSTTNRVSIERDQIPQVMVDAIVAVEDANFFEHSGVDIQALARAMLSNAGGNSLQGGSTITQQWVKNVLATTAVDEEDIEAATEQTLSRKLREAKLAIVANQAFTKDEILTSYLNTVYFGDQAYGLYAAAHRYYSVAPVDLNLNQAATLAGLVQAPSALEPTSDPKAARQRRNEVLGRMLAEGYIGKERYAKVSSRPLRLNPADLRTGCAYSEFPHYCNYVRDFMLSDPAFGASAEERQQRFDRGGLVVHTALDPKIQRAAIDAMRARVGEDGDVAAAGAVMRPGTPEVVAMATNRRYGRGEYETEIVYANTAVGPLGSNFKPFVLAAALESGFPQSTRLDTPSGYYPAGMWAPDGGFRNANLRNNGYLDARGALRGSVNTWFIQLIERIGVRPVVDFVQRLGITTLPTKGDGRITEKDASLALGTYDANPLEVVSAYSTFIAGGRTCRPSPVLLVEYKNGAKRRIATDKRCYEGTTAAVADTVANMLTSPFEAGGTASSLRLDNGRPAGGKTGTTDNSSATWFTGFTPQYAMTVWVGDPRGGFAYPLRNRYIGGTFYGDVFGATIAGPIWQEVMNKSHKGLPVKKMPAVDPTTAIDSVPAVPDLVGLSQDAAASAARDGGFRAVDIAEANPADAAVVEPGMVVRQQPAAGQELPVVSRDRITLFVVR